MKLSENKEIAIIINIIYYFYYSELLENINDNAMDITITTERTDTSLHIPLLEHREFLWWILQYI